MSETEQVQRLLPSTADPDTAEFWRAAADGRLTVCECASCGALLHLPTSFCHQCRSWQVRWRDVRPTGTIYSWTTVAHTLHPSFPAPYTVALIQLDDVPEARFVGHFDGEPAFGVGTKVRATFSVFESEGVGIPMWELADGS